MITLLLALAVQTPSAAPPADVSGYSTPQAAPVVQTQCETAGAEIASLEGRVLSLQAALGAAGEAASQNARDGQTMARRATALNWATGVASLMPGVGIVASAAGAQATRQAILANQRATAATNETTRDTVSQLVPLSQQLHAMRMQAQADGCELPPSRARL